ncbi:AAEL008713-PA [Aedes aegypti]|uniref:AAEL008713-PA n=1 Tax=Aedes aegypti TaxID=7159 RepID=Q16Y13_AEDAE|nr:AAEL008713-PA [Aedes aegypti]
MGQKLILVGLLITLQIIGPSSIVEGSFSGSDILERHKRTLLLTEDSATGILAAIAIPLQKEKPSGVDIFCSYNFEANYGMTVEASDWTDPFKRFRVEETQNGLLDTGGEEGGERRKRQSLAFRKSDGITRRRLYHVIEQQLWVAGYDGRKCLLRAICEASRLGFHEHNGVVGDLIQIILSPSLSADEQLPVEFYKAEMLGLYRNCTKYRKYCPRDVLDLLSYEL